MQVDGQTREPSDRLLRIPEPFDHPDWLFELKLDGFRALAFIDGHHCRFVSRNGHTLKSHSLADELAHTVRQQRAILDGEIACLDDDGEPCSEAPLRSPGHECHRPPGDRRLVSVSPHIPD